MTYQALARKWRPRRFEDLVGQAHVVRALEHALTNQRLHHALLFSGTRGVGKTTLGRIIAKCLNCEHGVSAQPCAADAQCSACAEIDAGRFVDLIEVDAASRTGVDDTRELMDNVQYAPARGRYKVYLIDEVHMLSRHAFNALLKTLEEPPGHVQFLLATTEPQKLPVTILSRCLQFPLKRLPVRDIAGQLRTIADAEGIQAEDGALNEIARAAEGSMRDGQSLLDQAIAFGGGTLEETAVLAMLGNAARDGIAALLTAIANGDAPALLAALERLDEQAPDYAQVLDALAAMLHRIAVLQLVPDAQLEDAEALMPLANQIDPTEVQLFYDIALRGRRDLDWAPDPKSGVEMTCLRMLAFCPAGAGAVPSAATTPIKKAAPAAPQAPEPPAAPATAPEPATQPPAQNADETGSGAPAQQWDALVGKLQLTGMAAELARQSSCQALDASQVRLELPAAVQHLLTDRARRALTGALQAQLGDDCGVDIRLGDGGDDSPAMRAAARSAAQNDAARAAIESDPTVQALQDRLGARVREDSIRPVDESGQPQ